MWLLILLLAQHPSVIVGDGLDTPTDLAWDTQGRMLIVEHRAHRLTRFNGQTTERLAEGRLKSPLAVIVSARWGTLVADTNQQRVVRLSGDELENIEVVAEGFKAAFDITLDESRGWLYVADSPGHAVWKVELNGGAKTRVAELDDPRAVLVSGGDLYILERHRNVLHRLREGKIERMPVEGLNGPKHLALDSRRRIVLADSENHRILLYNPEAQTVRTIDAGKLNRPSGVAIGPDGRLYIADSYNHRILRVKLPD
jgi:sugar lactone lactonase YvrE